MSEVEKKPDWCIVRWRDGDLLVYRRGQWEAQGKHYPHKWEYVAEGLTHKKAMEFKKLFKE
jgi:hypothetical protein